MSSMPSSFLATSFFIMMTSLNGTFQCCWPFVREIHRWSVNYPHKGQCRWALMFSLICARINGWVNNNESGYLRCHRAHYDVTVMMCIVMDTNVLGDVYITPTTSRCTVRNVKEKSTKYITVYIYIYIHASSIIFHNFLGDAYLISSYIIPLLYRIYS